MSKSISHIAFLLFCCISIMNAQPKKESTLSYEDEFEKNYQKRIKKERINGVYIPKDLNQALLELTRLTDEDSRKRFKSVDEETAVAKIHFSLGRWIIHNWGFYEGSRLSVAINDMGVHTPDDMAQFIIRTFHRSLNKKELKIKDQLQFYADLTEKRREEKMKKAKVLHKETRIRPRN